MTQGDWIKARSRGIGGTDIAAILGHSKYRTRYDVWMEKTGQHTPFVENAFTRSGVKLERIVVEFFEEATGMRCEALEDQIISSATLPEFIIGSPDRIATGPDGQKWVLECKTTQNNTDADTYPEAWHCQLQWYMGISGIHQGYIAWLVKGVFFDYTEVQFSAEYFNACIAVATEFWQDNVQGGVIPEPQTAADVVKRWPLSDASKAVEATQDTLQLVTELRGVRASIKVLEDEQTALEEALKLTLREAEYLNYEGMPLVTWKSTKPTQRLDVDRLKTALPDVYQEYLKAPECSRRFLMK